METIGRVEGFHTSSSRAFRASIQYIREGMIRTGFGGTDLFELQWEP